MASIEECPETDEDFLEQVHELLEQLNTHSDKVNSLSKERSELRDQLMNILLSLRLRQPVTEHPPHVIDQLTVSKDDFYKQQLAKLKQLLEEMSTAKKKHLATMDDLQETMRLVEDAENRYQADSIDHPARQSLIELIARLGEIYFACLNRQQQAFARCRQLECAILLQKQILNEQPMQHLPHIKRSEMCRQTESITKVLMRKVELRLKMVEVEMKESRRNYRKTMRSLEKLSEQIHQARVVMAQVGQRRALLANAAVSLLATHNRLMQMNAVLVLLCSLRKAKSMEECMQ